MIDINLIRENSEKVKNSSSDKNVNPGLVDDFLLIDKKWRELTNEVDNSRFEQKKLSDERKIDEAKILKNKIQQLEEEIRVIEEKRRELWEEIPNPADSDVPVAKDESGNVVIRQWGDIPKFDFEPKDHADIGKSLGIIDIERAGKVSGTRFGYFKGGAALLELALLNYTFKALTSREIVRKIADTIELGYYDNPFVPVFPPVMIKPDIFRKMARLKPEDERYYIPSDDIYLIGSAEHTLGAMHIDETLNGENLPIRYLGFSTSFRREAGSYGKDTRGMLRVHQFDKIEMESFTSSEDSRKEHEFFVAIQEYLMKSLGIPYRVVLLCTGDMGGPDSRQVDIESWLPGQNRYRETHSADLMTDFQSRRLNTKIRNKKGETELAHMNDATAFAIGRTIIAILENYQTKDGTVIIPEILREYLGFDEIK